MATSLNLFDPPGPAPAGERATIPGAARPAEPGAAGVRAAARASTAKPEAAPLDRFAALLGRAPTDAEKLELVRVKEALDLDNNDALWLLIMGLDHLRGRFEHSIDGQRRAVEAAIDGQRRAFEQAIARRLDETRQTTDALIESARARFLEQFPAALKQAARRVSVKALGFDGPVVLSGPVAGVALALAGLGAIGAAGLAYGLGERSGYERGERAGFDKGVLTARAETAPKSPAPAGRGR